MKTENIKVVVDVKITYDKGYKKEAIEKALEACAGVNIWGGNSSAETLTSKVFKQ